MNLEEKVVKYKDITLKILEIVKDENYENLDESFEERQLILDEIKILDHSKEELRKLFFKHNVAELDKMLESEINSRKDSFLEKIKESQRRRKVMNGYNNMQTKAVFLSKKF